MFSMTKKISLIFVAILALSGIADAQPQLIKRFKLDWQGGAVTEKKDAEGNIVETNRPLGYKVYEEKPTPGMIGEAKPDTNVTFTTNPYTATEGAEYCYTVTAFNQGMKDNVPVLQESAKSNVACAQVTAPAPKPLPLTMFGSTKPEYAATEITVTKPANAIKSFLTITVRDGEFDNEGRLWIGDNGPIMLFPGAPNVTDATNSVVRTVQVEIPLDYWVDGVNRLLFGSMLATGGYEIQALELTFELSTPPPPAPTGLQVSTADGVTVNVSRRAEDTTSVVSVLVNKDEVIGPQGVEIAYPQGTSLNVSRRASNTTSVVSFLVNKSLSVTHNGQPK
jgi:hypothetical protein